MENTILIILTINLIVSLIIASFADKNENGFANAFFTSFIFTPVSGILFVLNSKRK